MDSQKIRDLLFLYCATTAHGNAHGMIAQAHVTVCRGKDDTIYFIPDDPGHLPLVKSMLERKSGE